MAKDNLADKFFGLLFGRWWAGLLIGCALIAAGAYVFWSLPEDPGQGAALRRSWRLMALAGLLAGCGGLLVAIGVMNLLAGQPKSKDGADEAKGGGEEPPRGSHELR